MEFFTTRWVFAQGEVSTRLTKRFSAFLTIFSILVLEKASNEELNLSDIGFDT